MVSKLSMMGLQPAPEPPAENGWLRASVPITTSTQGYNTPKSHFPRAIFWQSKPTLTCQRENAPGQGQADFPWTRLIPNGSLSTISRTV
jgi:hypothetical protein